MNVGKWPSEILCGNILIPIQLNQIYFETIPKENLRLL